MLMWSSVAASGFGDRMIQLAAWEVLGMREADAQASSIQAAVYLFFFLPYLLFAPLGGWLADRVPRKWVLLSCDELRGILLLTSFFLMQATTADRIQDSTIYVLVFGVGVLAAVFSPTRNATVPQIVPVAQLQSANAIVMGIAVIASMIGLGVGGRLIEEYSISFGLKFGAGLFLISGLFFAFLKVRPSKHLPSTTRPQVRLIDGIRYLSHHKRVMQLVWLNVLFWAAANVFLGGMAALCKLRYDIPQEQLLSHIADMGMFTGLGMLSSSLCVAWLSSRRESNWVALLSMLIAAICMVGVALSHSYTLGVVLAALTGFFGNTAMICIATLTQSITPNRQRGRVFGIREMLTIFSVLIVNFAIWRLPDADRFMIIGLFVTAGVLGVVSLRGLYVQLTSGPFEIRRGNALWRIGRAYAFMWHRLKIVGSHHVPRDGGVILASNHTTAIDPTLLQAGLQRHIRWVMLTSFRFSALNIFWNVIQPIALNRDSSDTSLIRQIITTLKAGEIVGFFPEGQLQRDHRELQPFEPGIGLIASRSGAVVVPVWVEGTPLSRHMLMHFLMRGRTRVVFGEPYVPDPEMDHQAVADDLRQRVEALSKQ